MSDCEKISADVETTILAAAYTIYHQLAENPISPDEFHVKYMENGHTFSDFVLGHSEK